MNRPEITARLSEMTERYINPKRGGQKKKADMYIRK